MTYATRVALDHYLSLLALFGAAVLAGVEHGMLWGIAIGVGLWLLVAVTNPIALATGNIWALRINRWLWIGLAYALLLLPCRH